MENFRIISDAEQNRDITGYRPRKAYTYDYDQNRNDELLGSNGCVIFRATEAYLNYMEACYEKNGSLDGKAQRVLEAIRRRAGVDEDFSKPLVQLIWATKMTWPFIPAISWWIRHFIISVANVVANLMAKACVGTT